MPVFERDALIDELLAWNFEEVKEQNQLALLHRIKEFGLNLLSGVSPATQIANTKENLFEADIELEMLIRMGEVQPHLIPLIDRFREVILRIAVHRMAEPERLAEYQRRLQAILSILSRSR